jgi:hypothetical protein
LRAYACCAIQRSQANRQFPALLAAGVDLDGAGFHRLGGPAVVSPVFDALRAIDALAVSPDVILDYL